MTHVESIRPSSDERQVLAEMTINARKGTPLETGKTVETLASDIEAISADRNNQVLVAVDDNRKIVGWISYYMGFRLMAFINGFLPVVDPMHEPEKIATSLIRASMEDIVDRGFSRLEIELILPTDAHRRLSQEYIEWYKNCGFRFAAEEAHMISNLSTVNLSEVLSPKESHLRKLSEACYKQLERPCLQTFQNSDDRLFRSMKPAEQEVNVRHFFRKSEPFIEDASLVLEREGKILGFVITRIKDDEAEIGPIGLIPGARGQGLGSYLLNLALTNLKSSNLTHASLDVSIENHPARALYKKFGFKDAYFKQFYFWSP